MRFKPLATIGTALFLALASNAGTANTQTRTANPPSLTVGVNFPWSKVLTTISEKEYCASIDIVSGNYRLVGIHQKTTSWNQFEVPLGTEAVIGYQRTVEYRASGPNYFYHDGTALISKL